MSEPVISQAIINGQYLSVAGFIVLFWDHLLTLNREKQYIWSSRQTVMKWAFLINRYLTLVTLFIDVHERILVYSSGVIQRGLSLGLTQNFSCQTWTAFFTAVGIISLLLQDLFVLLKMWLLWEKRGMVMMCSALLFILIAGGELSVTAVNLHSVWFSIQYVDHLGCALHEKPKLLAALWILSVCISLVMLSIAAAHATIQATFDVLIFVMIFLTFPMVTAINRTYRFLVCPVLELVNLYLILTGPLLLGTGHYIGLENDYKPT
ncbi:hypothetical protein BU17DRAFT_69649 [Hysterangium stoloniferum]|nr:hypothetical protein BU17DRAFT_69649 [Hysterangium stoloniferum]